MKKRAMALARLGPSRICYKTLMKWNGPTKHEPHTAEMIYTTIELDEMECTNENVGENERKKKQFTFWSIQIVWQWVRALKQRPNEAKIGLVGLSRLSLFSYACIWWRCIGHADAMVKWIIIRMPLPTDTWTIRRVNTHKHTNITDFSPCGRLFLCLIFFCLDACAADGTRQSQRMGLCVCIGAARMEPIWI